MLACVFNHRLPENTAIEGSSILQLKMQQTFAQLQKGGSTNIAPLLAAFTALHPAYVQGQQQDAHEFLVHTFDQIPKAALQNISFQQVIQHHHPETGYVSTVTEDRTSLELNFGQINAGTVQLQSLVNAHFDQEHLDFEESLRCPETGEKRHTVKSTSLRQLKPVLILVAKRFHTDSLGRSRKCNAKLEVPQNLSVPAALSNGGTAHVQYRRAAAVVHHGTLQQGHYTATLSRPEGHFFCDDATTTQISESKLKEILTQAYIIAYVRGSD